MFSLPLSRFVCSLMFAAGLVLSGFAPAQAIDYPAKPITVYVGFAPGGGTDQVARFLCGMIEQKLGQPVVVSNIPGASGARSIKDTVRARPDGYTVLFMTSNLSTLQATGHSPYTYKDLKQIAGVNFDAPALIVRTDSPWKTLEDFTAAAKASPKKINVGSGTPGGLWHLSILALEHAAEIKVNTVPSTSGGAAAAIRLMGKHLHAIIVPPNEALAQLKSGEFRMLAIMTEDRIANFPDVPTFKEKGLDLVIASHRGFHAPTNTPDDIVQKLAGLLQEAVASPQYAEFMTQTFSNALFEGPEEFTKYLEWELPAYTELVEKAGLKVK